jgi:hypothetical protein
MSPSYPGLAASFLRPSSNNAFNRDAEIAAFVSFGFASRDVF